MAALLAICSAGSLKAANSRPAVHWARRGAGDLGGGAAGVAAPARRRAVRRWQLQLSVRATPQEQPPQQPANEDEAAAEGEGLLPEEDWVVPGTYMDAISSNTLLGRAVKGACEELDALGALEGEQLAEAEALLKSVGWKGSLFAGGQQQQGGGAAGGDAPPPSGE